MNTIIKHLIVAVLMIKIFTVEVDNGIQHFGGKDMSNLSKLESDVNSFLSSNPKYVLKNMMYAAVCSSRRCMNSIYTITVLYDNGDGDI